MALSRQVLLVCLVLAALFFAGSSEQAAWFFGYLREGLTALQALVATRPLASAAIYAIAYAGLVATNLPVALVMTPAAGAIFGLWYGTVLAALASALGATAGMLLSRFVLRDVIERRFEKLARRVNRGIQEEGGYYLFALRLVPVFPFFAVNVVMGLTRLPAFTFWWVSQLGMLPGTLVFVNAGAQLGRIETPADVLSPQLIGSLALLGIFPLLARRAMEIWNARRRIAGFTRPRRFDANLVVIGAGSAGLVTAYIAAASGAKVFLVEAGRMGGDCLNTGCVPSKALIRSARLAHEVRRAAEFGLENPGPVTVNFRAVMQRVRRIIERIEPHDSVERYTGLGVECLQGRARLTSPWTVEVDGRVISTRSIVIATGARPAVPAIPGLRDMRHLTSENIWELDELPRRLLVLGGGAIGCEMAQAFRRLGSEVTLVELLPRLLEREDEAVSTAVEAQFAAEGIRVLTGWRATAFRPAAGGGGIAVCEHESRPEEIPFDEVLVAVGRTPRTHDLGLEAIGIRLNDNGTILVNEYLQATLPNIYACGDVTGIYQLTHAAAHQAWYCAMNALYGMFWRFRVDYSVIPWAVFTDPEVARVGRTADEAASEGIRNETVTFDLAELDRAIADGDARGFVKVVTEPGSDRILGATVVGPHAGEIIGEFTLAMRHGLGLRRILGTVHIYPTLSEAAKFAAGAWQRQHLPTALVQIAAAWNRWRRA